MPSGLCPRMRTSHLLVIPKSMRAACWLPSFAAVVLAQFRQADAYAIRAFTLVMVLGLEHCRCYRKQPCRAQQYAVVVYPTTASVRVVLLLIVVRKDTGRVVVVLSVNNCSTWINCSTSRYICAVLSVNYELQHSESTTLVLLYWLQQ